MSGENFLLLLRLGFSLSLVFGLMWVAAKVLRARTGGLRRVSTDQLEVLERKPLGKGSSIAIVRVGEEVLAVGITDSTVTLLGPAEIELAPAKEPVAGPAATPAATPVAMPALDPTALRPTAATPSGGSRRSLLDVLRDKTVRHIPG